MANSLYQKFGNQGNQGNNIPGMINQFKSMGPSNSLFKKMYESNPQFKSFADSVRGKTPEEAFRQTGLNFDDFRHLKW